MGTGINNSLDSLFNKMENYVSTKTVVGEPMKVGTTTLLPLIDVSFGVGAGSSEKTKEKDSSDTGVGGLGAKITPSAVIAIQDGNIQLINVKNQDSVNKIIDMVPGVISKVDSFIKSRASNKSEEKIKQDEAKKVADAFAEEVVTKTDI